MRKAHHQKRYGPPKKLPVNDVPPEDQVLLDVLHELFDGDWDALVETLNARRHSKPFIFKLAAKIDEDLKRIERLRKLV